MEALEAVLDELDAALDRAHAVPLLCHRGEDVAEWLCRLQSVRARVDALCCSAAVAAGSCDVPGLTARRDVPSVVAAATGHDRRAIVLDVGLGRWLSGFGEFEEAFADGRLSRRHLQALRRAENTRTGAHLVSAQAYLIEAAVGCDWQEFNQVLRYWELAFDPDGEEPAEQTERRFCRLTKRHDGTVEGRFLLDPIAGQAVITAVAHQEQRLFRSDTAAAASSDNAIMRTATQRRADALVQVLARGAARPDGSIPAPLVHLVFGAEVLDAVVDSPSAVAIDPNIVDQRCELVDGTPIHPRAGLAVVAGATLRRLVLSPSGEVLDLGRSVRSFPSKLKHALLVAARGRCQQQGCDAPFAWLQADHVHPWHRHGPTAMANGQILCDPHNKAKRDRVEPEQLE